MSTNIGVLLTTVPLSVDKVRFLCVEGHNDSAFVANLATHVVAMYVINMVAFLPIFLANKSRVGCC